LKIKSEKLRGLVIGIPDPREKAIIVMRYGLDGNEPLTQRHSVDDTPISRSYVSRIEKRALERLGKDETAVRINPDGCYFIYYTCRTVYILTTYEYVRYTRTTYEYVALRKVNVYYRP